MLWDVDDIARLYVNGTKVFEAIWRHVGTRPGELKIIKHGPGNSGWQVINQYLKEGTNELTFEEYNHAGCCSAALWWQVARGQEIVDQDRFRRPDSSQGKKYSKTIKYEHTCNPPIKNAPMGNVPVG
jgi:hypothetical protein